ncbi:MAG: hypothetical protein LQ345_001549 [Seirophora villosa]|nr:MAG: hypothetical protein LQ345_001549 [Seirophora villosa]
MATSTVVKPFSQMMRTEFERSLCLRIHLKHRRLYSSGPPPSRRPQSATNLTTIIQHKVSKLSPRVLPRNTTVRPFECVPERRDFSTAAPNLAAIITTNPRKDEEGHEMLIDITERASTRLKEIMTKDSNPSLALRVTVESGGCHGFQYLMSLTNMSAVSQEEDTVFEASNGSGAKVVMDEPSLELLKGSTVDFTMELIGSQFKIVGNPAATSSCGCGTSFDIKP